MPPTSEHEGVFIKAKKQFSSKLDTWKSNSFISYKLRLRTPLPPAFLEQFQCPGEKWQPLACEGRGHAQDSTQELQVNSAWFSETHVLRRDFFVDLPTTCRDTLDWAPARLPIHNDTVSAVRLFQGVPRIEAITRVEVRGVIRQLLRNIEHDPYPRLLGNVGNETPNTCRSTLNVTPTGITSPNWHRIRNMFRSSGPMSRSNHTPGGPSCWPPPSSWT